MDERPDPFLEELNERIAAPNPHDSNGILSQIIRYELDRQRLMDQRTAHIRNQVAYDLAVAQARSMVDR